MRLVRRSLRGEASITISSLSHGRWRTGVSPNRIELRGVQVHNLRDVDLDLPHHRLIVFCGVSGSGKTSLALDTLYAEGQRRYIESFSAYTRQFLEQLEKPEADRIDGLPPAIAVTRKDTTKSNRSTVGTATEVVDYLRLLFAKIGRIVCRECQREVQRDTPDSILKRLREIPAGTRTMVAYPREVPTAGDLPRICQELREDGFVRIITNGRIWNLADQFPPYQEKVAHVIVDRLVLGEQSDRRLRDSIETANGKGAGCCVVFVAHASGDAISPVMIDDQAWDKLSFHDSLTCSGCGREYLAPEPRLFNFNSSLGACPSCEGFGSLIGLDLDRIVPDPRKSIRDGAIAPWNSPAYSHELDEFLAAAKTCHLPVDIPFNEYSAVQRQLVFDGDPDRGLRGVRGFFDGLEKHKYKMPTRVYLSRWRRESTCPHCNGQRLRPESLAVQIDNRNFSEMCAMSIQAFHSCLNALTLSEWEVRICGTILDQLRARLRFLESVGLHYLTLHRTLRTLSAGEGQRIALTTALGSSLVNMLYILDEPTVGLHPRDTQSLIKAIRGLRDRGNTVVVVEHDSELFSVADQIVEVGPGAGESGGNIVFQGSYDGLLASETLTADYLTGRRLLSAPEKRRQPGHGWLKLTGCRGNNLKNITVEFPLGVLCLVTGVSGSGKSTLVQDTLYGAICNRKHKETETPYPYSDVFGDGQIDDVVLVDQSPIGRSPRSNPVTYIKAFDLIRAVFAETIEARTHNYDAGYFSFNVEGGRCETCHGDGYLEIDMQFLPDVFMKCGECGGTRYRNEILGVTYRGRNIADVLKMTAREAFSFFRGQAKVQHKLKQLLDVGLDYLRLGQPANTLSAGEAQRLKLASYLSAAGRTRTLFLLDEPTTGLHFADVVQLLDCFDALMNLGHSLIVVDHNVQLMTAADYLIDLGPGAADEGGYVVAVGTPEKVARAVNSATGRALRPVLLPK